MFEKVHFALIDIHTMEIGNRMTYVRFKGKICGVSIINVYAPTSSADDRDKFYLTVLFDKPLERN